jgi:hypothetical protein
MKETSKSRQTDSAGGEFHFLAHPPERRRRSIIVTGCGCCCCCCCCLHTLGGVIGAAVAGATQRGRAGASLYWRTVAVLLFALALGLGAFMRGGSEGIIVGVVIGLLVFPGVQLAASLLAVLIAAFQPEQPFPTRSDRLRAIGWITIWTVVGALIGIAVMVGIGVILSLAH